MKNELKSLSVFENVEFGEVRTVLVDKVIYFVGNDVAKVLEYARPRDAISDHCKGAITYRLTDNIGREQDTKVIPESDLYRLIFKAADQSKNINIKEKAEKFEKWIFEEVLPTIRKHGAYISDTADEVYVNNELRFGRSKTIKTFSNAQPHEINLLYSEFRVYVDNEYKRDTDERIYRYKSVEKGLDTLLETTANMGFHKIGDCYNIKLLKEQVIVDRTNLEKRVLGGEKGGKTRTINTINGNMKVIESELIEAKNKVADLEILLENSLIYPPIEDFITINKHGMSNNSMFDILPDGRTVKSDTYVKWINSFPKYKMPSKDYWNVDWTQPIEMFINYVALPSIDSINMDKASVDQIIGRCYLENDNIVHQLHSARVGTCEKYWEGSISFYIRNIE